MKITLEYDTTNDQDEEIDARAALFGLDLFNAATDFQEKMQRVWRGKEKGDLDSLREYFYLTVGPVLDRIGEKY